MNINDLNPTRITFAGDWHGNVAYAAHALRHASDEVVIQVGDCGLFPDSRGQIAMLQLENSLQNGQHLLIVDGNHEDHRWLAEQPVDADGVRRLTEHIWHLPRGLRWSWLGVSFLALGGAHSIDSDVRVEGADWFPEERLSPVDVEAALVGGHVDVMITHDAPDMIDIPISQQMFIPPEQLEIAQCDRRVLGHVVDAVTPYRLYHGHFHTRYTAVRSGKQDDEECVVMGLDMDGEPFDQNLETMDTLLLTA